jgi:hypothetical protein
MLPCFVADDLELAASSATMYHPTNVLAVQNASIPVIYKESYSNNSLLTLLQLLIVPVMVK